MPSTSTIDNDSWAAHFFVTHRFASVLVLVFIVGTFALVRWGYKGEPHSGSSGTTRIPECLRNRCPASLLAELEGSPCPDCGPKHQTMQATQRTSMSFYGRFRRILAGKNESPNDLEIQNDSPEPKISALPSNDIASPIVDSTFCISPEAIREINVFAEADASSFPKKALGHVELPSCSAPYPSGLAISIPTPTPHNGAAIGSREMDSEASEQNRFRIDQVLPKVRDLSSHSVLTSNRTLSHKSSYSPEDTSLPCRIAFADIANGGGHSNDYGRSRAPPTFLANVSQAYAPSH